MSKLHEFFADNEFADEYDTDTGKPGIDLVAQAIQFWSGQNAGKATVRQAAIVFQMPDEAVREAVEHHYWMFIEGPDDDPTKQIICHEGM